MPHMHGRSTFFTSNKSTVAITNLYALFNGLNFRNYTEIFRTSLSVSKCITFSERLPPNSSSTVAIDRLYSPTKTLSDVFFYQPVKSAQRFKLIPESLHFMRDERTR